MAFSRGWRPRWISFVLFTGVALFELISSVGGFDSAGSCNVALRTYSCPHCGGLEVENCQSCEGHESNDEWHRVCFHRILFNIHRGPQNAEDHYHYYWNDMFGAVVWFATAAIAITAGVGGGGIYVPLGILLFRFAPKQASGLSQVSVFGASLGGLVLNVKSVHPNERIRAVAGHPDDKCKGDIGRAVQAYLPTQQEAEYTALGGRFFTRPLIHYDMALFLAPMEMAGALLGVLIQKILPDWLYLLLAGVILAITSYKTYTKFFSVRKAEQRSNLSPHTGVEETMKSGSSQCVYELVPTTLEGEPTSKYTISDAMQLEGHFVHTDLLDITREDCGTTGGSASSRRLALEASADEGVQQRVAYLLLDEVQFPLQKIFALCFLWLGLLLLTLLKGGKGIESIVGISCGSRRFVCLIILQFAWLLGFSVLQGRRLHKDQAERVQVKYPFLEDDPQWDWNNLRVFGLSTFVAGVVAGLIGVGGGMVLGPLMMEMGVNPRVASATTATMIVLTASSVVFIVLTSGVLHWSYAIFYFWVCFAGALYGKSRIDGYIQRTGKASIIIFILATIIALATAGCLVIMLLGLRERNWCFDHFQSFCSESSNHDQTCPSDRK